MNHTSYTVIGNAEARQMQKKIGKRDNKDAPNIFGKSSGMSSARTALYSYFLSLLIPISPSHIAPPYKIKNATDRIIGKTCPSNIFLYAKKRIKRIPINNKILYIKRFMVSPLFGIVT